MIDFPAERENRKQLMGGSTVAAGPLFFHETISACPRSNSMKINADDALTMLRKWHEERRVIHCTIKFEDMIARILGRIDSVDEHQLKFSAAQSRLTLGEANNAEIPLLGATFFYTEGRHVSEDLAKLKGYDAMLTISHDSGLTIGLPVMHPLEESASV